MMNKLNKKIVRLIFILFTFILIGLSFISARQDIFLLMSSFVIFTLINLYGFEHYFQRSKLLSEFNISLSIFVIAMTKFILSVSTTTIFIFFPNLPFFANIFIEFVLFTLAYIFLTMSTMSQEAIKSESGNLSNTFYLNLQEITLHLEYDASTIKSFNKLKKMINLISKFSTDNTLSVEKEILIKLEGIPDNKFSYEIFCIVEELLLKREKLIKKKRD